jgi:hypothetical protein
MEFALRSIGLNDIDDIRPTAADTPKQSALKRKALECLFALAATFYHVEDAREVICDPILGVPEAKTRLGEDTKLIIPKKDLTDVVLRSHGSIIDDEGAVREADAILDYLKRTADEMSEARMWLDGYLQKGRVFMWDNILLSLSEDVFKLYGELQKSWFKDAADKDVDIDASDHEIDDDDDDDDEQFRPQPTTRVVRGISGKGSRWELDLSKNVAEITSLVTASAKTPDDARDAFQFAQLVGRVVAPKKRARTDADAKALEDLVGRSAAIRGVLTDRGVGDVRRLLTSVERRPRIDK